MSSIIKKQNIKHMIKFVLNFNAEAPDKNYSMCTLGQLHHIMEEGWTGWWTPYFHKG